MKLLLFAFMAWGALIEPAGDSQAPAPAQPSQPSQPSAEPAPAPAAPVAAPIIVPQQNFRGGGGGGMRGGGGPIRSAPATPRAAPSGTRPEPGAGGLRDRNPVVPRQQAAPLQTGPLIRADPTPNRNWQRSGPYYYDPFYHSWYFYGSGYWWHHYPAYGYWMIYDSPGAYDVNYSYDYGDETSWTSPDGKRLVQLSEEKNALLYDNTADPPRLIKKLTEKAVGARFAEGIILVELKGGGFKLYDYEGNETKPPSKP